MPRRDRTLRRLTVVAVFSLRMVGALSAQERQSPAQWSSPSQEELKTLAARILKRADKAKCRPNHCTILVENFTTPSGSTSLLGIQLADGVSAELAAPGPAIPVIDRSRLREYLVREHIPSKDLTDREAARWLATEFRANAAITGKIEWLGDHFSLLVELLNVSKNDVGPQEALTISVPDPERSFAAFEPYDQERAEPVGATPRSSRPTRGNQVSVPQCIYCPPPPYSDSALKAKFTGTVVLMVTVTEAGRAGEISIVKGTPFGLNGQAVKAVREWKFKPANDGEKPISVAVPIEVTFPLY